MMKEAQSNAFVELTANFETLLDFFRFGLSQAQEAGLHYGHGTDNAWDEISSLIFGSLNLPFDSQSLLLQARLTAPEKSLLCKRLQARILDRVPLPYLLKEAYFAGLSFYVDERVLIPRSPLAEWIEQQGSPWIKEPADVRRVLDLCTGSACIAIACAYAFPEAEVDAVDLSEAALEVAAINRERHGLDEVLNLVKSDLFEALPKGGYDLIISNPPYVGAREMRTLPDEYNYEPKLALETAEEGLFIVKKILKMAYHYLAENGILLVEVGNSQEALMKAFPALPFTWLSFERGGEGVFLLQREQLEAFSSDPKY